MSIGVGVGEGEGVDVAFVVAVVVVVEVVGTVGRVRVVVSVHTEKVVGSVEVEVVDDVVVVVVKVVVVVGVVVVAAIVVAAIVVVVVGPFLHCCNCNFGNCRKDKIESSFHKVQVGRCKLEIEGKWVETRGYLERLRGCLVDVDAVVEFVVGVVDVVDVVNVVNAAAAVVVDVDVVVVEGRDRKLGRHERPALNDQGGPLVIMGIRIEIIWIDRKIDR